MSTIYRRRPPEERPAHILSAVKKMGHPIFTTHELASLSGTSASAVVQRLNRLWRHGVVLKLYRGIWTDRRVNDLSAFELIPYLFPRQRVYVSFISALHLHGMIEQIPQVHTLASLAHTRRLHTALGDFSVHKLSAALFDGFDWYRGSGRFLIAEPEKALIDSLYVSSRRKKQFGDFPELVIPRSFNYGTADRWIARIPEEKIRRYVRARFEALTRTSAARRAGLTRAALRRGAGGRFPLR